ncbi:MAG: sialate O-acetylesterase [Acidobacteriaceae bacterium]|nr:sialate O-acetylesterase [Acidobacteriaceae bacterium]
MKFLARLCSAVAAVAFIAAGAARAEIKLPHLLSDHAVLQRDAPIHIWGWADPGEAVTVHFHDQTRTATADDLGKWSLWLMPERPGGPYGLRATGSGGSAGVTLSDLLVGDVWLASGQSNMEMPLNGFPGSAVLKNGPEEIAHATLPTVRLLRLEHATSEFPLNDISATWTECNPQTAADFSAVAYFFGREINQKEKVPVGLIDTTWGGTPVESWISLMGISSDAGLMPLFRSRALFTQNLADDDAVRAKEKRERDAAEAAHQPLPQPHWHPDPRSWEPAALYNGMIAPETPYTIKGVIWYQGETNSDPERAPLYAKEFVTLIADWRRAWGEGDFPFLYVQISNFYSPNNEDWGRIRDAQRRTLAVVHTAMAVTLDVGTKDNVHPPDKQTVGARLALAARAMVYREGGGERGLEYSGPLFRETTVEGSSMRVWFDHAESGLTSDGAPMGFEIAGQDGNFVAATAKIDGLTVVVQAAGVAQPRFVRYGWASWTDANLFNKDKLPASTFTSQRLP